MATQRELVMRHPGHAIMNIDVLSFERLAYRVFDELGTNTLTVLEETGKLLVLQNVARTKEAQLTVLKGNMAKKGYIAQMKSLISELTQYHISPEIFREMVEQPDMPMAFCGKAQDILTMYQGFLDDLKGRYITTEEILELLIQVVEDSGIVRGSVIALDGFTGFTPVQNLLLERLLTMTEEILVTVTCDVRERLFEKPGEQELFAMSKKMITSLADMAERTRTQIAEPVLLSGREQGRFAGGGCLQHLEQNLFRVEAKSYRGDSCGEISVAGLSDPRRELEYVAAQIVSEVREKNLRYRDFAVVCADINAYRHMVPGIFDAYEIPYFIDAKRDIVFHPLIEMIKGLLAVAADNFSYDSVFGYLRCGLVKLSTEEIDLLNNYVVCASIRGKKKYLHPFTTQPAGYTAEELVRINEIRRKFMEPLQPFLEQVSGGKKTVLQISTAIYQVVAYYDVEQTLSCRQQQYEAAGDMNRAREYQQIYGIVMELLDKMVLLLGAEEMTLDAYGDILEAGLEEAGIGVIPPGYDNVVIGDLERTRLEHVRVLYLVGANDGAIPGSLGNGGILSQLERQQLKDAGYELAPTDREKAFMQRFYLYLVMSKPSDKLVLTYAKVDASGKGRRRSYLISTLQKLFPQLSVEEREEPELAHRVLTAGSARRFYIHALREYAAGRLRSDADERYPYFAGVHRWLEEYDPAAVERLTDGAFYVHKREQIGLAAQRALYGGDMSLSVTRLEQYARCAYAYFLQYGLGLRERSEYELESVDMGSLYHHALEGYAGLLEECEEDWFTVGREKRKELLQQAVKRACQQMEKADILRNGREQYLIGRMSATLEQTVETLTAQVRRGSFAPKGFEVDFREIEDADALRFALDEMHTLQLYGKIDRMDLWETPDKVYVRIVDYKSGNRQLELLPMYHGLQIQLVLYMDAALRGTAKKYPGRQVLPGGMFYYHVHQPVVDGSHISDAEEIQRAVFRELKMRGLVNADLEVIRAMDKDIEGTSEVIPVRMKKDGGLSADSRVMTDEEFEIMSAYVRKNILKTGRQMLRGEIDCAPYQLGDEDGCTYCPYHAVCGFDSHMEGYGYRKLQKMDAKSILEEMEREVSREGEDRLGT